MHLYCLFQNIKTCALLCFEQRILLGANKKQSGIKHFLKNIFSWFYYMVAFEVSSNKSSNWPLIENKKAEEII